MKEQKMSNGVSRKFSKTVPFMFVLAALVIAFLGIKTNYSYALTTKNLRSKVQSYRLGLDFNDVKNGTSVNGENWRKYVKIVTVLGAEQILSWVSNVTIPFVVPGGTEGIYVESIRGYDLGTLNEAVTSLGDVGLPPNLGTIYLENRLGNSFNYSFYDEINSVDVGIIVNGGLSTDLNNLTQGAVDFYITKIE